MDDTKFLQFVAAYPSHRRVVTVRAKRAFAHALEQVPFAILLHALEQHKRSDQWRKQIVPSLVRWLEESRWLQTLPEPQPAHLSVADEAQRMRSLSPQEQLRRLGVKR
jgi:hypothetical protein